MFTLRVLWEHSWSLLLWVSLPGTWTHSHAHGPRSPIKAQDIQTWLLGGWFLVGGSQTQVMAMSPAPSPSAPGGSTLARPHPQSVCPLALPRAAKAPTASHSSAHNAQWLEGEGRALPVPRSPLPVLGSGLSHHAPWQVFLFRPSVNRKCHVLFFFWSCLLSHSCLFSSSCLWSD